MSLTEFCGSPSFAVQTSNRYWPYELVAHSRNRRRRSNVKKAAGRQAALRTMLREGSKNVLPSLWLANRCHANAARTNFSFRNTRISKQPKLVNASMALRRRGCAVLLRLFRVAGKTLVAVYYFLHSLPIGFSDPDRRRQLLSMTTTSRKYEMLSLWLFSQTATHHGEYRNAH